MRKIIVTFIAIVCVISFARGSSVNSRTNTNRLSQYVITVQPIVARDDFQKNPASMAIPTALIDRVFQNADISFHFLEPIYWDNTSVRDGLISLDSICKLAESQRIFRGVGDLVNMVFVDKAIGRKGPLGFGMMNGSTTFISLGDSGSSAEQEEMQAFVIAHEVGHNLGLQHIVDDKNIPQDRPNIMGDGAFGDRIDPKYSLTPYQINEIKKSPLVHRRIELLSREEAQKIVLDESFEYWISMMQPREINAYMGQNRTYKSTEECRTVFKKYVTDAMMDFTEQEAKELEKITEQVIQIFNLNHHSFIAQQPWRFIKTSTAICGGFAFTKNNCILLSENHLQYMIDHIGSKELLMERLGKLIVHEQLHVLQRTFPRKFDRLNSDYWNFIKADIPSSDEMIRNQVSNPDAMATQWIIDLNGDYYWPRVLLNEDVIQPRMGRDFVEYAFYVKRSGENYHLVMKRGKAQKKRLSQLKSYTESYAVEVGIDHPNEISAYLFADYFISFYRAEEPFSVIRESSKATTSKFISWVKKEL